MGGTPKALIEAIESWGGGARAGRGGAGRAGGQAGRQAGQQLTCEEEIIAKV